MRTHPLVEEDADLSSCGEQGEGPEKPSNYLTRIEIGKAEGDKGDQIGKAEKEGQGGLLLIGFPLRMRRDMI